jgi:hypothetical protein
MKRTVIIAAVAALVSGAIGAAVANVVTENAANAKLTRAIDREQHHAAVVLHREKNKAHDAGYTQGRQDEGDARDATEEALTTEGYHDPARLARSIKSSKNKDFKDDDLEFRMDDVDCISQNESNTRFTCLADYSDDTKLTLKVTVAKDGSSWISETS